jgi:hypothetical protein
VGEYDEFIEVMKRQAESPNLHNNFLKGSVQRAVKGRRKHKNSKDNWKNWELEKFIDNAQEELFDAYNYLEELRRRLNDSKTDD